LDAAASAVRPILELPTDRWTAWLGKRVARMADLLQDGPFGGYRPAQGLRDEIREVVAAQS
jgi:hypothetical protein